MSENFWRDDAEFNDNEEEQIGKADRDLLRDNLFDCVKKGAYLLDEKQPGWANLISLTDLNLTCEYNCVLGRIYSTYTAGLNSLEIENGFDHGFNAPPGGYGSKLRLEAYNILRELWTEAILDRRILNSKEQIASNLDGIDL